MATPFDHYPYTNFHELNLAYFIVHFREIFAQWDQLYSDMLSWKDATDEELAEWKAGVLSDIDAWETALNTSLDAWKADTETDITGWMNEVIDALDLWKAAFQTLFDTTFSNLEDIKTDAEDARDAAIAAQTEAEAAQAAAEAAAASVAASAAQIETNTSDIGLLKNAVNETNTGNDENFTVSETGANYFQKPVYKGIKYTFTNRTSALCSLFLYKTYIVYTRIITNLPAGKSVTFVSDDNYNFIGGTYQGTGTVELYSVGVNDLSGDVESLTESMNDVETVLTENDLKRISVPFSFAGHWNINSEGTITSTSASQSSYDMYAVDVSEVNEIVCDPIPEMYGFYATTPEVGSTSVDNTRHSPPAQGRITKVSGAAFIVIRYTIGTTNVKVTDGEATKNATAMAATVQDRLEINLENYCKNLLYPIATLVDDDSNITYMPGIKAACDDENIKCSFGVIYTVVQNDASLLALLKSYQEDGYHVTSHPDIGDTWHTTSPDYDLSTCESHVIKSLVYLQAQGFLDCNHLISPGGAAGIDLQRVYKKWCVSAVGANNGESNHLYGDGRYNIHRLFINPSGSLAEYQAAIDAAYAANDWMIFGTHSWSFTTAEDIAFLKSVIEYAKTKGFVFQTYNQAYKTRCYLYDVDDLFNQPI